MILEIINKEYDALMWQLKFVLVAWIIVIVSIGFDLFFGIKKSKEIGIFTHSYGLRQTSQKVVQYLSFMAFMLFFDALNVFWVYLDVQKIPLATLFGAIVLVYTEAKSVREKTSDKFRKALKHHPKEIIQLIKDNKDLVEDLIKKDEN
jgi:hypothetical protein